MADPQLRTEGTGTTISQLRSTVAPQRREFQVTVAQFIARLDRQVAQIQKVSTELATASPSLGGLEASKFGAGRNRCGPTGATSGQQRSVIISKTKTKI
jgi:hypothetical protein